MNLTDPFHPLKLPAVRKRRHTKEHTMLFKQTTEPTATEIILRMVTELAAHESDQDKLLEEIADRLRRIETRLCMFLVREGYEDIVSKPKDD